MWGVIAAWIVCLASLSLPWPGIIVVALLCCLAFFEFAGPTTRVSAKKDISGVAAREVGRGEGRIIRAPAVAVTRAFQTVAETLHRWRGVKVVAENKGCPEEKPSSRPTAQPPLATFLKGSIGSFSRGGLMVTHDGRVIYKVNQDRGLIAHPSLNKAQHTIFGIFDGHGENGEHVAAYAMREVPRRLATQPSALHDPTTALKNTFVDINVSLPRSGINAIFGGTTAVVALVRDSTIWIANAGDSRAIVVGRRPEGEGALARALTWDQNPDSPGERERIERMGGFVSDPEESGASARVWLDATRTMVGLAMSRSIGDLAVKQVGVIAEPVVTEYQLAETDEFLILASDGVWEFISNQEAGELVRELLDRGEDAAGACKGLMELANRRWSEMVGDYRDDITATVVRLPFLPPAAAAVAAAAAAAAATIAKSMGVAASAASVTVAPATASGKTASGTSNRNDQLNACSADSSPAHSGENPTTPSLPKKPGVTWGEEQGVSAVDEAAASESGSAPAFVHGGSRLQTSEGKTQAAGSVNGAQAEAVAPTARPVLRKKDTGGQQEAGANSAVTPESLAEQDNGGEAARRLSAVSEVMEDGGDDMDDSYGISRASRNTDAMEDLDEDKWAEREPQGASAERVVDTLGVVNEEDEEMEGVDDDDWDLDFGAREFREPSREMREASREFPNSSPGLDPLEALVEAGADKNKMAY